MIGKDKDGILEKIYSTFKPLPQTSVSWNDVDGVSVHWEYADGCMRWFLENGQIKFEWHTQ